MIPGIFASRARFSRVETASRKPNSPELRKRKPRFYGYWLTPWYWAALGLWLLIPLALIILLTELLA